MLMTIKVAGITRTWYPFWVSLRSWWIYTVWMWWDCTCKKTNIFPSM